MTPLYINAYDYFDLPSKPSWEEIEQALHLKRSKLIEKYFEEPYAGGFLFLESWEVIDNVYNRILAGLGGLPIPCGAMRGNKNEIMCSIEFDRKALTEKGDKLLKSMRNNFNAHLDAHSSAVRYGKIASMGYYATLAFWVTTAMTQMSSFLPVLALAIPYAAMYKRKCEELREAQEIAAMFSSALSFREMPVDMSDIQAVFQRVREVREDDFAELDERLVNFDVSHQRPI